MLFHIRFRNLCLTRINENQKSYDLYHLFSEKHIGYLVDHGKNVRVFCVSQKPHKEGYDKLQSNPKDMSYRH